MNLVRNVQEETPDKLGVVDSFTLSFPLPDMRDYELYTARQASEGSAIDLRFPTLPKYFREGSEVTTYATHEKLRGKMPPSNEVALKAMSNNNRSSSGEEVKMTTVRLKFPEGEIGEARPFNSGVGVQLDVDFTAATVQFGTDEVVVESTDTMADDEEVVEQVPIEHMLFRVLIKVAIEGTYQSVNAKPPSPKGSGMTSLFSTLKVNQGADGKKKRRKL